MFDQGTFFRRRYLTRHEGVVYAPLVDVHPNVLDSTHIEISSAPDGYITASAMAFMQGLYPPAAQEECFNTSAHNGKYSENQKHLSGPVCKYQYPDIKTFPTCNDRNSIAYVLYPPINRTLPLTPIRSIQGHVGCNALNDVQIDFEEECPVADSLNHKHKKFYHQLWDRIFAGTFPRSETNFYNAYDLYDYALWRWTHDPEKTRRIMTASELAQLRALASAEQVLRYANLTDPTLDPDALKLRGIAGRTLASHVPRLFRANIASGGVHNKLNLLFTTHEPFLSFFALTKPGGDLLRDIFSELPYPGATIIFELYSNAAWQEDSFPPLNHLRVRFLYRNSTAPDVPLRLYPIFGHPLCSMSWKWFEAAMNGIGIEDAREWCRVCGGNNPGHDGYEDGEEECFCEAIRREEEAKKGKKMSQLTIVLIVLVAVLGTASLLLVLVL